MRAASSTPPARQYPAGGVEGSVAEQGLELGDVAAVVAEPGGVGVTCARSRRVRVGSCGD
jgi:hypothetical protein